MHGGLLRAVTDLVVIDLVDDDPVIDDAAPDDGPVIDVGLGPWVDDLDLDELAHQRAITDHGWTGARDGRVLRR